MSTEEGHRKVKNALLNGSEMMLGTVCSMCGGRGTVDDRSSPAFGGGGRNAFIDTTGGPPKLKCASCLNGWIFERINLDDLRDWLFEELKAYSQKNPRAFLSALVGATEDVMVPVGPR